MKLQVGELSPVYTKTLEQTHSVRSQTRSTHTLHICYIITSYEEWHRYLFESVWGYHSLRIRSDEMLDLQLSLY